MGFMFQYHSEKSHTWIRSVEPDQIQITWVGPCECKLRFPSEIAKIGVLGNSITRGQYECKDWTHSWTDLDLMDLGGFRLCLSTMSCVVVRIWLTWNGLRPTFLRGPEVASLVPIRVKLHVHTSWNKPDFPSKWTLARLKLVKHVWCECTLKCPRPDSV